MPLIGMTVTEVDAGTVVGKDADGNDMVVTETNAVVNGSRVWVTPRQYALIKAKAGETP